MINHQVDRITSADTISCVIVLFNPDNLVLSMIKRLHSAGYKVIVVVNAAPESMINALTSIDELRLIHNVSNVGLATALNLGLEYGFTVNESDFVILFDQDSEPEQSLPLQLVEEMLPMGLKTVACIGPQLKDIKNLSAVYGKNNAQLDPTIPRSIPTSGTVISKQAWLDVGPMNDALFIDGIDHEWCFRAYSKGYQVRVSSYLNMLHNMGDSHLNYFGEYKAVHRSPIRHYFIVRNALFLGSLDYLPLRWRVFELIKTIRRIVFYLGVSTDRPKTFKYIIQALKDGLRGQLGACKIE